jgi:hypothetical protein
MKILFLSLLTMACMMSFYSSQSAKTTIHSIKIEATLAPNASSFKLVNDTGSKIRIHTGSGVVSLNNGGSTSINCDNGRKIHTAPNGSKDDLIFEVDESMCGKTIKLSKYL